MRRVGILVRISRDRAEEVSTDLQRANAEKYAADRGWSVVDVYEDRGRSAYKRGVRRPAFDRLMADVEAGVVDVVIAYRLDRVARSLASFMSFWSKLDRAGADFVSLSESFDTSTAMGRAMLQMAAVFAELESAIKSERQRDAHRQLRAAGARPSGSRPFGYTKAYEPDPAEAEVVAEMARRVLAGESILSVRDWLNGQGLTTGRGGAWTSASVRYVLLSPHVAALRAAVKPAAPRRSWHADAFVPGDWQPIIDRKTWDRLRDLLLDPERAPVKECNIHLLSGLARCGLCGRPMAQIGRGRYGCPPHVGGCNRVSVNGGDAEAVVVATLMARLRDVDLEAVKPTGDPSAEAERIEAELVHVAGEYGAGRLDRAQWQAARAGFEARLRDVHGHIRARKSTGALAKLQRARSPLAMWERLPVDQQRRILLAAFDEIVVEPVGKSTSGRFDPDRVRCVWRA